MSTRSSRRRADISERESEPRSAANLIIRPPVRGILVDHRVVEVVLHDRLEQSCDKSRNGCTSFPGLVLEAKRGASVEMDGQTLLGLALRSRDEPGTTSKADAVLRASHAQAAELASDPLGYFRRAESLIDKARNLRENLRRKYSWPPGDAVRAHR